MDHKEPLKVRWETTKSSISNSPGESSLNNRMTSTGAEGAVVPKLEKKTFLKTMLS